MNDEYKEDDFGIRVDEYDLEFCHEMVEAVESDIARDKCQSKEDLLMGAWMHEQTVEEYKKSCCAGLEGVKQQLLNRIKELEANDERS